MLLWGTLLILCLRRILCGAKEASTFCVRCFVRKDLMSGRKKLPKVPLLSAGSHQSRCDVLIKLLCDGHHVLVNYLILRRHQ